MNFRTAVNPNQSPAEERPATTEEITRLNVEKAERYTLTSADIRSPEPSSGVAAPEGELQLPAASITFLTMGGANNKACQ